VPSERETSGQDFTPPVQFLRMRAASGDGERPWLLMVIDA
jgi:hypothetical protein